MLYITGDTHGQITRFYPLRPPMDRWGPEDALIIAGDFGYLFTGSERERLRLDYLSTLPFTLLFIDGNHEWFPQIFSYPEEVWNGGRVHRVAGNILHLMRGQVYTFADGLKLFTMGGGYSPDADIRQEGLDLWSKWEMPSAEEYAEARQNLALHGHQVDVIVTHTAPLDTLEYLRHRRVISRSFPEEFPLNSFLQEVEETVQYRHWYFGHFHEDLSLWKEQTALLSDIYDLRTGDLVELGLAEEP